MADIDFYQDDSDESQDDGADDINLGDYGELANPDEGLTPLQKLEKYIDSENIFSRQMVARSLLDTLRVVCHNEDDAVTVLKAMGRLSEDQGSSSYEATVRAEVMEQVPHLAMCCHQNNLLTLEAVPTYILPTVTHCLMDSNNQVRKTSQAALLVLLEQELVEKGDVEEQVCPVILDLSSTDSIDDFRTEAVALMSKMAPLVGQDITTRLFLPRFVAMCTDALFHVRKVCAANFGDMCSVVGQENTEQFLLPKFYFLCEDGVWGVRKACAECFMAVSYAASVEVRRTELASLFISLICDQSRWVRMAAFQALGGFISTFADPNSTGLYVNEEGMLQALAEASGDTSSTEKGFLVNLISDDVDQSENRDTENSKLALSNQSDSSSEADKPEQNSDIQGNSDETAMDIDDNCDVFDEHTEEVLNRQSLLSLEEQLAVKYENLEQVRLNGDTDFVGKAFKNSNIDNVSSRTVDNHKEDVGLPHDTVQQRLLEDQDNNNKGQDNTCKSATQGGSSGVVDKESSTADVPPDNEQAFNSFHYWRTPLPDVDLHLDSCDSSSGDVEPSARLNDDQEEFSEIDLSGSSRDPSGRTEETSRGLEQEDVSNVVDQLAELNRNESLAAENEVDEEESIKIHTASVSMVTDTEETVANIGSTHVLGHHISETTMTVVNGMVQDLGNNTKAFGGYNKGRCVGMSEMEGEEYRLDLPCDQDVIPQTLLDHYLSMTDPARAQTVDTEIARHCAYSLPAVAFTLGRRYWPCLKDLYETLAADMQWKVRRTLAFSIHELALILGEDLTNKDLVPIFNGFLKDLDEVRIGVLKRLADFLRLLSPQMRHEYLPKIADFLSTDNSRNWRFREELAQQLILVTELYSPEDIGEHLVPVAILLAEDRVAEVRQTGFRVVSTMLRRLTMAVDSQVSASFVNEIIQRFALSGKWIRRQTYAHLCRQTLDDCCVSLERFALDFLPSLITLGNDPIPNVRISLAKTLAENVIHIDYFSSPQNPYCEDLIRISNKLKLDTDRDVRYFINLLPSSMMN